MSTRLKPSAHFWVPVEFESIGEFYEVTKHRFGIRIKRWTRERTAQFWERAGKKDKSAEDETALGQDILGAIVDWRFEGEHEPFSEAALNDFMNDYPQATEAITAAIFIGQSGVRQKNSDWLSALFSGATAAISTTHTESSAPPTPMPEPPSA